MLLVAHGVCRRCEAKQAGGTPHARCALVLGVRRGVLRAVGVPVRTSLVVEASWLTRATARGRSRRDKIGGGERGSRRDD